MTDHSNLFHEALIKVRDVVCNRSRDTQSWQEVRQIVDAALAEARALDRAAESRQRVNDAT
jgi:hypothetical protein